jgi:hypothetical protein
MESRKRMKRLFELLWSKITESRVKTLSIIEHFDVLENSDASLVPRSKRLGCAFGFEGGKEAFHHGIIITIGLSLEHGNKSDDMIET